MWNIGIGVGRKDNFTAERVASFICEIGKQQTIYWDGKTPGLGLRVTSKGTKSYIFESRLHGQTLRLTIGNPAIWPLETQWRKDPDSGIPVEYRRGARDEAQRLGTLIGQGIDPRIQKAEKIAKATAQKMSREPAILAWDAYLAVKAKKWSERYLATHKQYSREGGEKITRGKRLNMGERKAPGALRNLLELPLNQIDRDNVRAQIIQIAETRPETARMALALMRGFLSWAADMPKYREQIHADVCSRLGRELPTSKSRDDCLQREQLALWFSAVRELPNPVIRTYLQCLLLTGARRSELSNLRWDDVDFQWHTVSIRDKVEGSRTIPLTPYVEKLLLELHVFNHRESVAEIQVGSVQIKKRKPSHWVFFSDAAKDGKIQEPRLAHNRALASVGLPPLSVHGLRRSFGTLAEWVECPAGIAAQIMGHKPSAIAEKHYRKRPIDLLRVWHTKIEQWILDQSKIQSERRDGVTKFKTS